ncbi:MAG: TolC family protein [Polyangiaceae bacterium]
MVTHADRQDGFHANAITNANGVNTPINNTYETSVELQKQLPTGTQLSLSLTGTRSTSTQFMFINGTQPLQLTLGPSHGVAAKASIVQPLLRCRARRRRSRSSCGTSLRTAAERARDRTASELLRDVIQAYWELWYAAESTRIEQTSLSLAQRQESEADAEGQSWARSHQQTHLRFASDGNLPRELGQRRGRREFTSTRAHTLDGLG